MNANFASRCRATSLAILLGAGPPALAHPGPPGHYHPDEVDEFDRNGAVADDPSGEFDLGGFLALAGIAGSLAFAFFQKESGIWSDVTSKH